MNIPTKSPGITKAITTLAGIALAIVSQPQLTVRELLAMLGALIIGGGAVSVVKK